MARISGRGFRPSLSGSQPSNAKHAGMSGWIQASKRWVEAQSRVQGELPASCYALSLLLQDVNIKQPLITCSANFVLLSFSFTIQHEFCSRGSVSDSFACDCFQVLWCRLLGNLEV